MNMFSPQIYLIELIPFFERPPASSSGAHPLARALRHYDPNSKQIKTLEDIPMGTQFKLSDGRVFVKELNTTDPFQVFLFE